LRDKVKRGMERDLKIKWEYGISRVVGIDVWRKDRIHLSQAHLALQVVKEAEQYFNKALIRVTKPLPDVQLTTTFFCVFLKRLVESCWKLVQVVIYFENKTAILVMEDNAYRELRRHTPHALPYNTAFLNLKPKSYLWWEYFWWREDLQLAGMDWILGGNYKERGRHQDPYIRSHELLQGHGNAVFLKRIDDLHFSNEQAIYALLACFTLQIQLFYVDQSEHLKKKKKFNIMWHCGITIQYFHLSYLICCSHKTLCTMTHTSKKKILEELYCNRTEKLLLVRLLLFGKMHPPLLFFAEVFFKQDKEHHSWLMCVLPQYYAYQENFPVFDSPMSGRHFESTPGQVKSTPGQQGLMTQTSFCLGVSPQVSFFLFFLFSFHLSDDQSQPGRKQDQNFNPYCRTIHILCHPCFGQGKQHMKRLKISRASSNLMPRPSLKNLAENTTKKSTAKNQSSTQRCPHQPISGKVKHLIEKEIFEHNKKQIDVSKTFGISDQQVQRIIDGAQNNKNIVTSILLLLKDNPSTTVKKITEHVENNHDIQVLPGAIQKMLKTINVSWKTVTPIPRCGVYIGEAVAAGLSSSCR
ncbi:hypothetical protein VP01_3261g2, partial [Puccinia sorghi]